MEVFLDFHSTQQNIPFTVYLELGKGDSSGTLEVHVLGCLSRAFEVHTGFMSYRQRGRYSERGQLPSIQIPMNLRVNGDMLPLLIPTDPPKQPLI